MWSRLTGEGGLEQEPGWCMHTRLLLSFLFCCLTKETSLREFSASGSAGPERFQHRESGLGIGARSCHALDGHTPPAHLFHASALTWDFAACPPARATSPSGRTMQDGIMTANNKRSCVGRERGRPRRASNSSKRTLMFGQKRPWFTSLARKEASADLQEGSHPHAFSPRPCSPLPEVRHDIRDASTCLQSNVYSVLHLLDLSIT
ncbi:hypothetical protein LX36DRAFT_393240 [Colletotrichum falcatum]|nr:hypothetical protein LX36DRAFT_393240 [Colletotrichum falcatum]